MLRFTAYSAERCVDDNERTQSTLMDATLASLFCAHPHWLPSPHRKRPPRRYGHRKLGQHTARGEAADLAGWLGKPQIAVGAAGDKTGHHRLRKIEDHRMVIRSDFGHRVD